MDVVVVENPWRCLCLGFRLQVTYRRFLRFTTRQSLHKRRTADLTRISFKVVAMFWTGLEFVVEGPRGYFQDTD